VDLGGPLVNLTPVHVHQSKRLAPKTLHTLGGPGGPHPPKWHRRPPLLRAAGSTSPRPVHKRAQAPEVHQVHQGVINFLPGKHFELVNLTGLQVHQGPPRSTEVHQPRPDCPGRVPPAAGDAHPGALREATEATKHFRSCPSSQSPHQRSSSRRAGDLQKDPVRVQAYGVGPARAVATRQLRGGAAPLGSGPLLAWGRRPAPGPPHLSGIKRRGGPGAARGPHQRRPCSPKEDAPQETRGASRRPLTRQSPRGRFGWEGGRDRTPARAYPTGPAGAPEVDRPGEARHQDPWA
jgi:hypothetical protein